MGNTTIDVIDSVRGCDMARGPNGIDSLNQLRRYARLPLSAFGPPPALLEWAVAECEDKHILTAEVAALKRRLADLESYPSVRMDAGHEVPGPHEPLVPPDHPQTFCGGCLRPDCQCN